MNEDTIHNSQSSSPLEHEIVQAFQSLFRGRTDVYGQLYDETAPDEPKYGTKKEPVTFALYRNHLLGKCWLGIHPLVGDKCCFGAIDLDEKDFQKALAIRDALQQMGLEAYIAETKHKGYRILVFFIEPQLAKDVRSVLKAANEKLGFVCEVFPKQNSLPLGSLKDGEIGSFVNLPCFGDRCHFLTGNNQPVSLEFALDNIKYNTEEYLRQALEKIPLLCTLPEVKTNQGPRHTPDQIIGMLQQPLAVGERRPTLVKLAGYLRCRRIPEEVAVRLLLPWAERAFTEPLPTGEVQRHIRGIYQRYGVGERKVPRLSKQWHAEVTL